MPKHAAVSFWTQRGDVLSHRPNDGRGNAKDDEVLSVACSGSTPRPLCVGICPPSQIAMFHLRKRRADRSRAPSKTAAVVTRCERANLCRLLTMALRQRMALRQIARRIGCDREWPGRLAAAPRLQPSGGHRWKWHERYQNAPPLARLLRHHWPVVGDTRTTSRTNPPFAVRTDRR